MPAILPLRAATGHSEPLPYRLWVPRRADRPSNTLHLSARGHKPRDKGDLVGKTATEIRTLHVARDREYRRRGY